MDSFETALAGPDFMDPVIGFRHYANDSSFIDLFLLNELSRNVDGYRLSSYLYKDKDSNGGKLNAGPAWDYDLAWGNANYCDGSDTTGWAWQLGTTCPDEENQVPFWWPRLMQDSLFVNAVRCRWDELRYNVLSPTAISAYCDSVAALLQDAQARNFYRWPILGSYVWPNPEPVPTTYAGEVQELKDFMNARWAWLDANMPGLCATTGIRDDGALAIAPPFPNPFNQKINFRTGAEAVRIMLIDPLGRIVLDDGPFTGPGVLHQIAIPQGLAAGSYVLRISPAKGAPVHFRMIH
jgi:hypothetical protein